MRLAISFDPETGEAHIGQLPQDVQLAAPTDIQHMSSMKRMINAPENLSRTVEKKLVVRMTAQKLTNPLEIRPMESVDSEIGKIGAMAKAVKANAENIQTARATNKAAEFAKTILLEDANRLADLLKLRAEKILTGQGATLEPLKEESLKCGIPSWIGAKLQSAQFCDKGGVDPFNLLFPRTQGNGLSYTYAEIKRGLHAHHEGILAPSFLEYCNLLVKKEEEILNVFKTGDTNLKAAQNIKERLYKTRIPAISVESSISRMSRKLKSPGTAAISSIDGFVRALPLGMLRLLIGSVPRGMDQMKAYSEMFVNMDDDTPLVAPQSLELVSAPKQLAEAVATADKRSIFKIDSLIMALASSRAFIDDDDFINVSRNHMLFPSWIKAFRQDLGRTEEAAAPTLGEAEKTNVQVSRMNILERYASKIKRVKKAEEAVTETAEGIKTEGEEKTDEPEEEEPEIAATAKAETEGTVPPKGQKRETVRVDFHYRSEVPSFDWCLFSPEQIRLERETKVDARSGKLYCGANDKWLRFGLSEKQKDKNQSLNRYQARTKLYAKAQKFISYVKSSHIINGRQVWHPYRDMANDFHGWLSGFSTREVQEAGLQRLEAYLQFQLARKEMDFDYDASDELMPIVPREAAREEDDEEEEEPLQEENRDFTVFV
jgi:hypothetical protein